MCNINLKIAFIVLSCNSLLLLIVQEDPTSPWSPSSTRPSTMVDNHSSSSSSNHTSRIHNALKTNKALNATPEIATSNDSSTSPAVVATDDVYRRDRLQLRAHVHAAAFNRQLDVGRFVKSIMRNMEAAETIKDPPVILASEASLAKFEELMQERKARIDNVCAKGESPQTTTQVNYPELYLERDHNLLWCPVYKASSTNWMNYFVQLSTRPMNVKNVIMYRHGRRINEVARELYPPIRTAQDLTSFVDSTPNPSKFLVVRHPFYRLVSAYRDKLERFGAANPQRDYYYQLYGAKIYGRYRERAVEKFGQEFFSAGNNFGAPIPPQNRLKRSAILPTFWEFVQFVKDAKSPSDLDIHWQPASTFCAVCNLKFDYILKFESISEEEQLFHQIRNITFLERQRLNPNSPTHMDPDKLTKIYFEQLTDEDVMALYKIYEMDFKLFDYTFSYRTMTFPTSTTVI